MCGWRGASVQRHRYKCVRLFLSECSRQALGVAARGGTKLPLVLARTLAGAGITDLTRRFHTIGIENLNVQGMMKNHALVRSIADMSFSRFRRQP